MPRKKDVRLPLAETQDIATALFSKSAYSGAQLAEQMGVNPNTLWSWFYRRGIKPEDAGTIADELEVWAADLMGWARRLRKSARQVEREARLAAAEQTATSR